MDGDGAGTFTAMAVGFGIALTLIVGAYFQEPIIAVVRLIADRAAASGRASARAAIVTIRRGGGKVGQVFAQRRKAKRPRLEQVDVERMSPPSASPSLERQPWWSRFVIPRAKGEPSAEQSTAPIEDGPVDEPPPLDPEPPLPERRPESVGARRRTFLTPSSINVDSSLRELLEERGHRVSLDAAVRHLDRVFGPGLGNGLVESMSRRGVIRIARDNSVRTEIWVELRRDHEGAR